MRAKIILPNFIAVLILGLVSYFYLRNELRGQEIEELRSRIDRMSLLHLRSEGLHGFEILNDVRAYAMSPEIVDVFAPVQRNPEEPDADYDKRIHTDLFRKALQAIESYSDLWFARVGKKPELVFLTDRNGFVIARNIDPKACPAGRNVAMLPVMAEALDSKANYAIWSIDDSPFGAKKPEKGACRLKNTGLLEMAAAPVWHGSGIAGALVVGFEISNGAAMKRGQALDLEVAFLTGEHVYSSSFTTDKARQSLERQLKRPEVAERVGRSVGNSERSDIFQVSIENRPYLATVLPVTSADKKDRIGTLILGSMDKATSGLRYLGVILALMGLMLIAVYIAGMILTNHFLGPVMAIEDGLLKIINGEYDYRFDVESAEVGGLSYRINQLVGVLTGEDDEAETEAEE